jgi:predicted aspartyl protease
MVICTSFPAVVTRKSLATAVGVALFLALAVFRQARAEPPLANAPDPIAAAVPGLELLPEITVEAPEPRFVAPTRRDRIGRIWAPVLINDKGPFRLVLDTGASSTAVTARVVEALGLTLLASDQVVLRGVTGSSSVNTIPIDSLVVGDLGLVSQRLPVVADVFGGAEGVLGTEGLLDKRILIDFRNDLITISRSHGQAARSGFVTIPFKIVRGLIVITNARVGRLRVNAIIDTGGQGTLGNRALGESLPRAYLSGETLSDRVIGTTLDIQLGRRVNTPPIALGALVLRNTSVTIGDMYIFEHWRMTQKPTLLIGMDMLGLLDTLIIDYRRHELQVRLGHGS